MLTCYDNPPFFEMDPQLFTTGINQRLCGIFKIENSDVLRAWSNAIFCLSWLSLSKNFIAGI